MKINLFKFFILKLFDQKVKIIIGHVMPLQSPKGYNMIIAPATLRGLKHYSAPLQRRRHFAA
jgi:hypothetical protein